VDERVGLVSVDVCPSKTFSVSSSPPVERRTIDGQRPPTMSDWHQFESTPDNKPVRQSSCEVLAEVSFDGNVVHRSKSITPMGLAERLASVSHLNASRENPPPTPCRSRTNSIRSHSPAVNGTLSRIDRQRRKALKLLIVIIVEFFLCWTPLFVYHTVGTFSKRFYRSMPTIFVDVILLFSFASPLCNPLTYYFMSQRYRAVLFSYLTCFSCKKTGHARYSYQENAEAMQLIKALRLHQQQNSLEYKLKATPSTTSHQLHPQFRANVSH
jgi:hypothetical protein